MAVCIWRMASRAATAALAAWGGYHKKNLEAGFSIPRIYDSRLAGAAARHLLYARLAYNTELVETFVAADMMRLGTPLALAVRALIQDADRLQGIWPGDENECDAGMFFLEAIGNLDAGPELDEAVREMAPDREAAEKFIAGAAVFLCEGEADWLKTLWTIIQGNSIGRDGYSMVVGLRRALDFPVAPEASAAQYLWQKKRAAFARLLRR